MKAAADAETRGLAASQEGQRRQPGQAQGRRHADPAALAAAEGRHEEGRRHHAQGMAGQGRPRRPGAGRRLPQVLRRACSRAAALLDGLYDGAAWLAALFMVGLLAMVLLSIVSRQLHFHVPGTDAYAGYLMAGCGFLALAHTLKRGEHIRVTLLLSACPARRGAPWSSGRWPRPALAGWPPFYSVRLSWQSTSSTTSPPATTPRRCGSRSWHGRRHAGPGDRLRRRAGARLARPRARRRRRRSAAQRMSDLAHHVAADRGAVPHPRQRRVDRPDAVGRGLDRHAAVQQPPGRRRDGGHHLGQRVSSWTLTALPLFVWMGEILFRTRLSRTCSAAWRRGCRRCPGGCCTSTWSAARSSPPSRARSAATCATIGKMSLPELKRAATPTASHRLAGRRRHAGPADPAVDHHDRLRRHRRGLDRAALHRRRAAGAAAGLLFSGYLMVWALRNPRQVPPADAPDAGGTSCASRAT
jgi:hypothetical protein